MAGSDYIPENDAQFLIWATSYSSGISADPGKYMMTAAQAASIADLVADFQAKLLIASNENTRTKPTIIDKDNARHACEELCRQYAIIIKNMPGIDDADKVAIGVRPINPDREPIDCPQTQPLLNILGNTPGIQTVVYADTTTPDKKARPFGASELQLFMGLTDDGEATLAQSQFIGKYTRNPIDVEFDETKDGLVATYYARWASARGETGPWSLPISMRIAA